MEHSKVSLSIFIYILVKHTFTIIYKIIILKDYLISMFKIVPIWVTGCPIRITIIIL